MRNSVAVQKELEEKTIVKGKVVPLRTMRGIGASAGVVVGPCRVISRLEDLGAVKEGEVLVFRTASPRIAPHMGRLAGLVTEVGGRLTTAAHYAREHGVPHVAGVEGLVETVRDGQVLRVDGSKGIVGLL